MVRSGDGELLTTGEVASLLTVTPAAVAAWRQRGAGPDFLRLGACVRYRRSDVLAWVEAQRVEPGR